MICFEMLLTFKGICNNKSVLEQLGTGIEMEIQLI